MSTSQNEDIQLRLATKEDANFIYDLRNDESSRQYHFNTEPIPFEKHLKWFNGALDNNSITILIAVNHNDDNVGQIRFNEYDDFSEIDIALDPDTRSKGIGNKLLGMAIEYYFEKISTKNIIAKIKKNNIASIKVFQKNNFEFSKEHDDFIEYIRTK